MDDIRPPRQQQGGQQTTRPNYNSGAVRPPQQPRHTETGSYTPQHPVDSQKVHGADYGSATPEPVKGNGKKPGKGLKIALIIVIVLGLLALGAAVWLYLQQQDSQKQIDELTEENKRLTQVVRSLDYDNRDAAQKTELAAGAYNSLVDTADELKQTCGPACDSISVPDKL